ncbi:MAG: pentapeptide repeat-containing protein [Defluviitaleaceae bacterium]|nr:pentapeptide repeat-containing protein [Defluviitaleaceae bacterium]
MTRTEAIKHFKEKYVSKFHTQRITKIKNYIKENQAKIESEIAETFKNLFVSIPETDKEVAFINCCILRTSFKNGGSVFLLSAYNNKWFLDKNPVELYYNAPWLWNELHEFQKDITVEAKKYVGKIKKLDIEKIKFEKVKDYQNLILPIFRNSIEKATQLEEYKNLKKYHFVSVRMGEYYDNTESIYFENNTEMNIDKVKPLLKPKNENYTAYRHYKNLDLSKLDFSEINFAYTRFENIDFSESIMKNCFLIGTKFINCNLTNTIFENSVVNLDFKNSQTLMLSLSETQKGQIRWV